MILRLMRKDLLLHRPIVVVVTAGLVLVVVLISSGFGAQRSDAIPYGIMVFFTAVYGSILATLFAGRDDRYRTRAFDLGLPVSGSQVIVARYLLSLLALPLWVCLAAAVLWAWRWPVFPSEAFTPENLALAGSGFVAGMGIFFPLTVWAGLPGLIFSAVGLQVLGLAVGVLLRQLPAARPALGSIGRIGPALRRLHTGIGDPWYYPAVVAVLLCLYSLSFVVARTLYRRKSA